MTSGKRILIPWKQRWQRFRYSVLPLLSFVACVALMLWMWSREVHVASTVGEVEWRRFDVTTGVGGKLLSLDRPAWALFEHVEVNAIIAQLDPKPVKAALATAQLEIARLEQEIDAAAAQFALTQSDRQVDHTQEQLRLLWQVQRYELDVLDRQTQIETARADLQGIDARIAYLEQVTARGHRIVAPQNVDEAKAQRTVIAARMTQEEIALGAADKQLQQARTGLTEYGPIESVGVSAILAPLQAAVATQRSRVQELQLQVRELVVRAPVSGAIAAVHRWPGQYIQAGDPIVTVAAEHGQYIVGYIRQGHPIRPKVGMLVNVRSRVPGQLPLSATVTKVGPQFEAAPTELLQDPRRPEWVLPIRVSFPAALNARPGELVDLMFDLATVEGDGQWLPGAPRRGRRGRNRSQVERMAPQRPATRREFLSGRAAADALAGRLPEAGTKGPVGQPAPPAAHYLIEVSRGAMACQFQVTFRADRYPEGTQWAAEALDLVEQLEDRLSIYREQSTLCDINRRAGSVAVALQPWLFGLLEEAQRIFLETDGAFDLTAGPLSRAWGFLSGAGRMPTTAELDTALARVGGQYVQLDPASHTVRLLAAGVEIDVNAIGKGYALDRAADQLRQAGMADFLIHGGQSSVLAAGAHPGTPEAGWTVGLRHPLRPDQRLAEFQLDNRALGTSGSGTQFFHHRGKRYGHLIDPRTGRPAEGVFSATVLAPTAAEADALATAFYVLGPEGAQQYCANHAEVGALLVTPGPKAGTVELSCYGAVRRPAPSASSGMYLPPSRPLE